MSATKPGHDTIWAWREEMGDVYTGEWAPSGDRNAPMEAEEFIRRDPAALAADEIVQVMIGVVVEGAVELCERLARDARAADNGKLSGAGKHGIAMGAETLAASIRALRPDALAALDRIKRDVRDAALEGAAKVVDDHYAKGDMGNPGHWIRAMKEATE